LKEHFLDDFARRFQAAGYTTLVYDNRHWGSSGGQFRNEVDPLLQTRDYFAAYDFAASLPDVDPSKVVYWGTSMSGGNVICAAALDKRIRGIISQTPFVSGEHISVELGSAKQEFVLADRAVSARGGKSMMIPVIPESMDEIESGTSQAILKSPDVFPFLEELHRRGLQEERVVTLQSLLHVQAHEPKTFISRVSPTPILMIVGDQDLCIPSDTQLAMYELAQEPKELHILQGVGHFGVYYGQGFEKTIKIQLEFLKGVF
jgi:fermentation-respiration switch protein FrsA (DUF1100 family)